MTPAPFRLAMRSNLNQIRYVTPVRPRGATGVVARVYAAVEREFGLLAPPVALHSPDPDLLPASWLLLREAVLVTGRASRAEKETVAAVVSLGNACPYCVEVHGAVLGGLHGRPVAASVSGGRFDEVADPGLRAIATWALDPAAAAPPADRTAELLGVMLAFHYLNRMVSVFLPDSPVPSGLSSDAVAVVDGVLGRMLRPTARREVPPGRDLDLLPAAPLPTDLGWAAPSPALADGLARFAAAVESAGRRVLDPSVRRAVTDEIVQRAGRLPGLNEDWTAGPLAAVAPRLRPATRLALLTAVVPQRVGAVHVAEFRRGQPADGALLAVTAWAALVAARHATAAAARRAGWEKTAA